MKLLFIIVGTVLAVAWLVFFTAMPLPAVVVLLMAVAWRDHRRRREAVRPLPDDHRAWTR